MPKSQKKSPALSVLKSPQTTKAKPPLKTPLLYKLYLPLALLYLLCTTVFWSFLGAKAQQNNADQLINPYLVETFNTFKHALFPGQHTYLLKWPVFLVIHLFGATNNSYLVATILISLMTVSLFVYLLYKIEKRPLVLGTLVILLASVLLLIPAQPYPGGLLPVNMAMVTTRNLEYILFIGSLLAAITAKRLKSWQFLLAIAGFILLIASDKLFLSISIGGAFMALCCYALRRRRSQTAHAANWLIVSIVGAVGALLLLWFIGALQITQISSQASGPFGTAQSLHQVLLAAIYAVLALLTNFGANPAFNTTYFGQMPHEAVRHLTGIGGPAIVINVAVLLLSLIAAGSILRNSLGFGKKSSGAMHSPYHILATQLIFSTLAAGGAFVVTNHYYAVDARYLSMAMFTGFIALAIYGLNKQPKSKLLVLAGFCVMVLSALSIPMVLQTHKANVAALTEVDKRNSLIGQALTSHPVSYLAGDYWRVVPARQLSGNTINIIPFSNCAQVRDVLNSTAWQPDLHTTSFAYLLTLGTGLTDFPACKLADVTNVYGRPNSSLVIAGTLDNPREMLLFYDHGANHSEQHGVLQRTSATTAPIPLEQLPNTACDTKTYLNIVAHEDDDLLFMSPDIQNEITDGNCVRTIYMTAGDAGSNQFYWLGREQGSEAAYTTMIGSDTIWIQRIVRLADNRFVTIANPRGNAKISLVFIRLPDGNLHGEGFGISRHESLRKLFNRTIPEMHAVYGQSSFTADSVISDLTELIKVYKPIEVHTQSEFRGDIYTDHSDHMAVSSFATEAFNRYRSEQPAAETSLKHYIGYPVHEMPENTDGDLLAKKVAAFLSYAKHDTSVCQSTEQCDHMVTYGSYLRRQYVSE